MSSYVRLFRHRLTGRPRLGAGIREFPYLPEEVTELLYVPRKLVTEWAKLGWGVVYPNQVYNDSWAVLMHPPGWPDGHNPKEENDDIRDDGVRK